MNALSPALVHPSQLSYAEPPATPAQSPGTPTPPETAPPSEPVDQSDIQFVAGARGLAAGLTCAVIEGAGMGLVGAIRTPQGVVKFYQEIWTGSQGLMLKTAESLLVVPGAVIAAPLLTVAGTVIGLLQGTQEGYHNSYTSAVKQAAGDVKEFERITREALRLDL